MRIASYSVATLRGILVLPKIFRARPDVIFLIVTIQDGQAREPYKLNIHASDVQIVGVMTTVGVVKETKKGFVDSFHGPGRDHQQRKSNSEDKATFKFEREK